MRYAFLIFLFTATQAFASIKWTNINVSTPQGVVHYHVCISSRFRLLPHSAPDTEFVGTCQSSTVSSSVGGPVTYGDSPFARVRVNAPEIDRTDCYFVDIYDIGPSTAIEIECGWSYSPIMFSNGFEP
jgi:hypothetical protein